MRFELTIPPGKSNGESAILAVEAPNWLTALQKALSRMGEEQIPRGKAVCEIKDDGSILVRNPLDGRQFHIRPSEGTEAPPKQPQPRPPRHTPFGTMTYLEAELGARVAAAAPALPIVEPSARRTNPHPCMVFDRKEIQRRVEEEKKALLKARNRRQSSPAMVAVDSARDVRFIQVVDVEPRPSDTLTSLSVDLDELRQAAAMERGPDGRKGPGPPKGFEWLEEALEAALHTCRNAEDVAKRSLPLLIAALPSRTAVAFIKAGANSLAPLYTLGHLATSGTSLETRDVKETPFELPLLSGMSMVLDNSPGGLMPASDLAPWLGYSPDSGLVAAITNGPRTLGVLLLCDALGAPSFSATDLALANYVATRLFPQLEYWLGSSASK